MTDVRPGGPVEPPKGDDDRNGLDPFGRPVVRPVTPPVAKPELDQTRDWSLPPEAGHKRTNDWGERAKRIGGPLGAIAVIAWTFGKWILLLLGKVALLFKIPLLGTVLTGAVSIVAYATLYGYPFAFWLVTSLMVHELGHAFQVKREGLQLRALNFVPFLGAYVMHEATQDPAQQARISIAGPIAGALFAAALYLVAGDDNLLMAVAYTGFFLNLLNLIPIGFLDGGGVGQVFTSAWWLLVGLVLVGIALASGTVFAGVLGLICLVFAYTNREHGWSFNVLDGIPQHDRASIATLYLCVSAVCAFGMAASFVDRSGEIVDAKTPAPIVVVAAAPISPAQH